MAFGQSLAFAMQSAPVDAMAGETARWLFGVWGASLSIVVIPWMIYRIVRQGDWVPLLMYLGGLLASLNEGALDLLQNIWYPVNLPGPFYQIFGVKVPLMIPFIYPLFVGIGAYWAYRVIARGLTVKGVFGLWFALFVIEAVLEMPGTSTGTYIYYGDQPFEVLGFPLWISWSYANGYVLTGFLMWLFIPMLKGWKSIAIVLMPIFGLNGALFATAWPNYIALNFEGAFAIPITGQWALSLFSLGISVVFVFGIAALVAKDSPWAIRRASGNGDY